jgi:hypothetical protein
MYIILNHYGRCPRAVTHQRFSRLRTNPLPKMTGRNMKKDQRKGGATFSRKKIRVRKTVLQQLTDLEAHLFLLREHRHNLAKDLDYIKAIAAELRVLVCLSSGTEGLLWRLLERYHVSDQVELHVAGSVDRDHPLARGLMFWFSILADPTRP